MMIVIFKIRILNNNIEYHAFYQIVFLHSGYSIDEGWIHLPGTDGLAGREERTSGGSRSSGGTPQLTAHLYVN